VGAAEDKAAELEQAAARATAQAVVDVVKPPVEKAARTLAEEAAGAADLLVDVFAGRKTFRGIISDALDEAFGPEPKKEPGAKPDLRVVAESADKKASR